MDPSIEYFERREAFIKLEAVADEDPGITNATDGFIFYDGSCGTEFDKKERSRDRPYFGGKSFRVTNKRAYIEGSFDIVPPSAPGAAGSTGSAHCERILLPGAFAITRDNVNKITRYSPISSGVVAAWSRFWQGGEFLNIESGRHVISDIRMAIGEGASAKARLQGTYTAMSEGAAPNATVAELISTISTYQNSVMLLGTVDEEVEDLVTWGRELKVSSGAEVKTVPWTSKRLTGHTGRSPTGSAIVMRPKAADIDLHAVRDANRLIRLAYRTYESDTKVGIYTEVGVQMQLDNIKKTNVEGYSAYEIDGPLIPTGSGNNEYYIAFGDDTPP